MSFNKSNLNTDEIIRLNQNAFQTLSAVESFDKRGSCLKLLDLLQEKMKIPPTTGKYTVYDLSTTTLGKASGKYDRIHGNYDSYYTTCDEFKNFVNDINNSKNVYGPKIHVVGKPNDTVSSVRTYKDENNIVYVLW